MDLISREAVLDETIRRNSIWKGITNSRGENLEQIINRLPSIQPKTDGDLISREELKKWLDLNFSFGGALKKLELFGRIDKELPTIQPPKPITHESAIDFLNSEGWLYEHDKALTESNQPKKGEWVESCACEMDGALVRSWICSECGNRVYNPFKKYCDECGSKNKSGV